MSFVSVAFLVFLPLFVVTYFLLKGTPRLVLSLLGSYLFYCWWDWRLLSLILASTIIDYAVGRVLGATQSPRARKRLLIASLVANLGLLAVFKYTNFFISSFQEMLTIAGLQTSTIHLNIILPVGISFYTFQTMSYTIDIYLRRLEPETSFLRFATFVAFFPQLVAGPIVRAASFLPQLRTDQKFDIQRVVSGLGLMLWGYFMKVVMADSLGWQVDALFEHPEAHSSLSAAVRVLFYAFQIYGDFAGYSLIAIGVARILGYDFDVNFNSPYFSASFSEFWTRWHISLSSWLRDYLYIPLGGNRKGQRRTMINLSLTMLLGGLWHGASWHFVLWGALHGLYLILQRLLERPARALSHLLRLPAAVSRGIAILLVFLAANVAWVFFRAQSVTAGFDLLRHIVCFDGLGPSSILNKFNVVKGLSIIAVVVVVELLSIRFSFDRLIRHSPLTAVVLGCAVLWAIAFLGTFSSNTFIYFQF